jgi:hypothetical protein
MQQSVREMKAVGIGVPDAVIEKIGNVLNWAVVRRKGLQKQVMPEAFQNQERTLNERILRRQILVIPNALAIEAVSPSENTDHQQDRGPQPIRSEIDTEDAAKRAAILSWRRFC